MNIPVDYRVWIKSIRKIFPVVGFCFNDPIGDVEVQIPETGEYRCWNSKKGECMTMQYIGEKDRNKEKIYEEFILKTNEAGWVGKVIFRNAKFCLEDSFGGFSDLPEWDKCEIIGNIFENPKLLKGDKK